MSHEPLFSLKLISLLYQNEIATLKETELTERKEWERKSRSRLDEEWKLQEDGLRERFRKERDAELDRVVQKLEAEVITGRKTMESEFSERMRYAVQSPSYIPTYFYLQEFPYYIEVRCSRTFHGSQEFSEQMRRV